MIASELRIGNYVMYNKQFCEVHVIAPEVCQTKGKNMSMISGSPIKYKNLHPIPLTEDLLLKLGFKSGNEYINTQGHWTKNKFGLMQCKWDEEKDSFHLFRTPNGDLQYFRHGTIPHIEYVHQLQNIYHSLTGQELTPIRLTSNRA